MKRVGVSQVIAKDPLRIRRRDTASEKQVQTFYYICISIPALIGLSLLCFLLFFLSPRGESVRLYQKQIYIWNHERVASYFDDFEFRFKIVPYADHQFAMRSQQQLRHSDGSASNVIVSEDLDFLEESEIEFEEAVETIYYYKESYFTSQIPDETFKSINENSLLDIP